MKICSVLLRLTLICSAVMSATGIGWSEDVQRAVGFYSAVLDFELDYLDGNSLRIGEPLASQSSR